MASNGVNKTILLGRVGKDPEVRYTTNGSAICNLTLATGESWKDKNTGEKKEKTEWHKVSIFGKLAEIAGEYVKKGSQLYVEGQLQTRKWQDQNGQDRYSTEVVVQGFNGTMQMLGGRTQSQQQAPQQPAQQYQPQQLQQQMQQKYQQPVQTAPTAPQQQPDFETEDIIPF